MSALWSRPLHVLQDRPGHSRQGALVCVRQQLPILPLAGGSCHVQPNLLRWLQNLHAYSALHLQGRVGNWDGGGPTAVHAVAAAATVATTTAAVATLVAATAATAATAASRSPNTTSTATFYQSDQRHLRLARLS